MFSIKLPCNTDDLKSKYLSGAHNPERTFREPVPFKDGFGANSIRMTRQYPNLGSASDWLNQISHAARPIRSTSTQTWVVTRHPYGISALVSRTSFAGETSGGVSKCRLFSQATPVDAVISSLFRFPLLLVSLTDLFATVKETSGAAGLLVCPCSHSRTQVQLNPDNSNLQGE